MWYGSGTIQVAANGSNATGTGTQFLGNVRVGDGIAIQGSASLHEVTGVTSNTQLTFAPAFAGTAGTGKAFRIVPVLGYDKDLSDAFNALRLEFGDQLSNLQPWATAPTLDEAHDAFGLSASGKVAATGTPKQARDALGVTDGLAEKVDNSTASLTPAPGKIPLADSKGNISPDWFIVDQLRASVEAASGGRMTVLYTANGAPCHMHVFPAFNLEDVAPGGELGTGLHPAFIFNGQPASEIFVGAYLASMMGSEAVSLPMADPRASINFDAARNLCKANGPGWDIMSNLDWAAIALWCKANGHEPRGNTNYGRSHEDRWETGRRQDGGIPGADSGTARTLTGSGPAAWAHDGTPAGIHDLVGNIWEWVSGMKLQDGRAWIAPDNGQTEESQLIDSGFDMTNATPWSSHTSEGASDLVKQSLLAPASPALSPVGRLYVNAEGERLPYRGGNWTNAGNAGLAALVLIYPRTSSSSNIGFRPRFRAQ